MLKEITIITVVSVAAYSSAIIPDIEYKYTSAFTKCGTYGATYWHAQNYESKFCSLGDIATTADEYPTVSAILVHSHPGREGSPGALMKPLDFTPIGHINSVYLYSMKADPGYTCLGAVAMFGEEWPDKNKYCCVANEYIIPGHAELISTKSGINVWTVIRSSYVYGLDGGNFVAAILDDNVSKSVYLLKGDGDRVIDVWTVPEEEVTPLYLLEVSDLKQIYRLYDCTIWRAVIPEGYYSVGDIVVKTDTKPSIGYALRPSDPKDRYSIFHPPVSYYRQWSNDFDPNKRNVTIWAANCPGGYVALGDVATTDGEKPTLGLIYCVWNEYVLQGSVNGSNWERVCYKPQTDRYYEVSMFEAVATSDKQQAVKGFGIFTIYSHQGAHYLLNKEKLTYYTEPPIEKIEMYDVKYDLSAEKKDVQKPVQISQTVIINRSNLTQTVHRSIAFSTSTSNTYTFSRGVQVGLSFKFTGKVPLIAELETTLSAQGTFNWETGETTTETTTDTVKALIHLPPRTKINATISAKEYKSNIPYTANIKKIYYNGKHSIGTTSGVYKGVAILEASVEYGEFENLPTT